MSAQNDPTYGNYCSFPHNNRYCGYFVINQLKTTLKIPLNLENVKQEYKKAILCKEDQELVSSRADAQWLLLSPKSLEKPYT